MAHNRSHTAKFKKDPLTDRKSQVDAQKSLPGKFPSNPFKDKQVRDASDAFYTPHKGGERK